MGDRMQLPAKEKSEEVPLGDTSFPEEKTKVTTPQPAEEQETFREESKCYVFDEVGSKWELKGNGKMSVVKSGEGNYIKLTKPDGETVALKMKIAECSALKVHQHSPRSLVWTGQSNEGKEETLHVKFATKDIADKFIQKFEEAGGKP